MAVPFEPTPSSVYPQPAPFTTISSEDFGNLVAEIVDKIDTKADEAFTQSGTGAVERTLDDKLKDAAFSPKDFDCVGDRTANDTTNFLESLTASAAAGRPLELGEGNFLIDSITTPDFSVIRGLGAWAHIAPGGSHYDLKSQICLRAGASITMGKGSVIEGCAIIHNGLLQPVTTDANCTTLLAQMVSDADTAVLMPYRDAKFRNNIVLGFNRGVYALAADGNVGRCVIEANLFDCNYPVRVEGWSDLPYVRNNQAWPFLTVHVSGVSNTNLNRPGNGYEYIKNVSTGSDDWCRPFNNFCYGYVNGHLVSGGSNITFMHCQADGTGAGTSGFRFDTAAQYGGVIGGTVTGYSNGIYVNTTSDRPFFIDSTMLAAGSNGINVDDGYVTISNTLMDSSSVGILVSANGNVDADSTVTTYNVTTPLSINSAALPNCFVSGVTPEITMSGGTLVSSAGTITSATNTGTYRISKALDTDSTPRKWCETTQTATVTTNGTGSGELRVSLPVTPIENDTEITTRSTDNSAIQVQIVSGTAYAVLRTAAGAYPGVDGAVFKFTIKYRTA